MWRTSDFFSSLVYLTGAHNQRMSGQEQGQTRSKLGNSYPRAEVDASHDTYLVELRKMYSERTCADCGVTPANWATLKRPAFVCINWAQKLRADASNKVKNCLGTYLWYPDEMEVMRSIAKC